MELHVFNCMLGFMLCLIVGLMSLVSTDDEFCQKTTDGIDSCGTSLEESILFRLLPTSVGSKQQLTIDKVDYSLKTLSLKPLLFEVENFVTYKECEHLIDLAKAEGLFDSETRKHQAGRGVIIRDTNQDRKLSIDEMMLTIEDNYDLYPSEDDILKLYADLSLDKNNDQLITPDELEAINNRDLERYLKKFSQSQPAKRSRHSKQTWIYPDSSTDFVFKNIQRRVQALTKLNPILIEKSDFQVVNYGVDGHYNAHHDSGKINKDIPCCTRKLTSACRTCRFATILMYLNNVEGGGETAFPVADNATIDSNKFYQTHQMNLVKYCPDANIKVAPEKGKVVLWYNHQVDPETNWLGELDEYSWHGGCPVTKGEKWIANFWIKVTDDIKESFSPY